MIIDTSVVVAILLRESDYVELTNRVWTENLVGIGAPTLVECGLVLSRRMRRDIHSLLDTFLTEANVTVIPFDRKHASIAIEAFQTYGKGRHPAKLNYGDCLTYATAKVANRPLLFKGNDFSKTDLWLA